MENMTTDEYEGMINFMRADLASGMAYTKVEMAVRKKMSSQGRDFDSEFEAWQKKRGGNNETSTGST